MSPAKWLWPGSLPHFTAVRTQSQPVCGCDLGLPPGSPIPYQVTKPTFLHSIDVPVTRRVHSWWHSHATCLMYKQSLDFTSVITKARITVRIATIGCSFIPTCFKQVREIRSKSFFRWLDNARHSIHKHRVHSTTVNALDVFSTWLTACCLPTVPEGAGTAASKLKVHL